MRNIEYYDKALSDALRVAETLRQRHVQALREVDRAHANYQAALDRWVPQSDCAGCGGEGAAHDGGPCPLCLDLLRIRESVA